MKHFFSKIQQLLLPYTCCICDLHSDTTMDLCLSCKQNLIKLNSQPIQYKLNMSFDRLYAMYPYQGMVKTMLWQLKYNHKLIYGKVLGMLLLEEISKNWYKDYPLPEAIIPVPMHIKKLQERGFNQNHEILIPVHRGLKIPINSKICVKHRFTKPQTQLSATMRKINIKNTFTLNRHHYHNYNHVAVFDDVSTTMSTVLELCYLLKTHLPIELIDVWVLCRNYTSV